MIVRDEQENLPRCLSSVAGLFDEIVVVDTGSKDRTREIAAGIRGPGVRFRLGRRLRRGAERGAGAGDGRLCLLARCRRRARPAPARAAPGAAGGLAAGRRGRLRGPVLVRPRAGRGRRADGRGSHPALPAPRGRPLDLRRPRADPAGPAAGRTCRCGGPTSRSGTPATPTRRCGSGSSSGTRRILEAELAERPDDPFVLFNLGSIAVERQDWPAAPGLPRGRA